MDVAIFSPAFLLLLGSGAGGVYLLLIAPDEKTRPLFRWAGTAGAILFLILVVVLFGSRIDWCPASKLDSWIFFGLFYFLAGAHLAAGIATIAFRNREFATYSYAGVLLSSATMFVIVDAYPPTIVSFVLAGGWIARNRWRNAHQKVAVTDTPALHEPFLACVTGGLLAVTLIVTIHYAYSIEAQRTLAIERRENSSSSRFSALPRPSRSGPSLAERDIYFLESLLIVGAVDFAIGTVGAVTRPVYSTGIISLGIMLQGIALSLAAFGQFHNNRSGALFASLVLGSTAVYPLLIATMRALADPALSANDHHPREHSVEEIA